MQQQITNNKKIASRNDRGHIEKIESNNKPMVKKGVQLPRCEIINLQLQIIKAKNTHLSYVSNVLY